MSRKPYSKSYHDTPTSYIYNYFEKMSPCAPYDYYMKTYFICNIIFPQTSFLENILTITVMSEHFKVIIAFKLFQQPTN